jgi:hypothetical protein
MYQSRLGWLIFATFGVAVVCLAAAIANAQTSDVYQLTYYSHPSNTTGEDTTFHIINTGTAVTTLDNNGLPTNGKLCADIYVFNDDEQEVACCGCVLTPDSETTLSIEHNLLSNPINPAILTNDGVIKIISGSLNGPGGKSCDPAAEVAPIIPVEELRAWGTHLQAEGTALFETEEAFASAPLTNSELNFAANLCSAIQAQGSGKGKCDCGYGD